MIKLKIVKESTGKRRDRLFAYPRYLHILSEGTEPTLPETRRIATKAFLDKFPDDPITNSQLMAFRLQCAALMALSPLAQVDFVKCFDQWKKSRFASKLIIEPS